MVLNFQGKKHKTIEYDVTINYFLKNTELYVYSFIDRNVNLYLENSTR